MRYRFVTCDVFTERRFGGNQLAVLPDADGLDTRAQMQAIAAEFNYSETTFVLPPVDPAHLARVRIFTPRFEMPFAGHPTVGTALVLAWLGRVPAGGEIVLEEQAGPVPVRLSRRERQSASRSSRRRGAHRTRRDWLPDPIAAAPRAGCRRSDRRGGLPMRRLLRRAVPAGRARQPGRPGRACCATTRSCCRPGQRRVSVRARGGRSRRFAHGCSRQAPASPRTRRPGVRPRHWPAIWLAGRAWPRAGTLAHPAGRRDGPAEPDRQRGPAASEERVVEVRVGGAAVPVAEGTIEVA